MKKKAAPKPTHIQAEWLRRIAVSPLMKTHMEGESLPRFSLQSGATVPHTTAQVLIRNGWVRERRDGLWPDDAQTYVALTPATAWRV